MSEGNLPQGAIVPDVVGYEPSGRVRESAESLLAGFPCQAGQFFSFCVG